jgi:hypothetical protein
MSPYLVTLRFDVDRMPTTPSGNAIQQVSVTHSYAYTSSHSTCIPFLETEAKHVPSEGQDVMEGGKSGAVLGVCAHDSLLGR